MAASGQIRTRQERVAALDLQPTAWHRFGSVLRNPDIMAKLGLVLVASIALSVVIGAWNPPLSYREGFTPSRDIVARVSFRTVNRDRTEQARFRAVSEVMFIYENNPTPLEDLEKKLNHAIVQLTANRNSQNPNLQLLEEFLLLDDDEPDENAEATPAADEPEEPTISSAEAKVIQDDLYGAFGGQNGMERLNEIVGPTFADLEARGVIVSLPKKQERGNQTHILVHPAGQAEPLVEEPISDVLLGDGSKIRQSIRDRIDTLYPIPSPAESTGDATSTGPTIPEPVEPAADQPATTEAAPESPTADTTDDAPATVSPTPPPEADTENSAAPPSPTFDEQLQKAVAARETARRAGDRIFAWLFRNLQDSPTLEWDDKRTQPLIEEARASVPDQYENYEAGDILAWADKPLDSQTLRRLTEEHKAYLLERTFSQRLVRFSSVTIMIFTMLVLVGAYMYYRDKETLGNFWRLTVVLALAVATMGIAVAVAPDPWRAELLPVMIFGMALAIAYRPEPALMITGVVSLILTLGVGYGLFEFVLLLGVTAAAALNVSRIRNRRKLIYVGLFAGIVAVALSWVLGAINNQPLDGTLLKDALRCGFWALIGGILMAGLLPFVEKLFGVLTDLSLLELGDVAHPVLQELIRRAPSTYNHSIAVGTLAEAAADSIGGRGLLCRVAAYFHDIGKMMGPDYFIENLPPNEESRHDSLGPSMSSLVIISHVKDGVDLARQHHLPPAIVDLIEQHHGTTQVGFFYEKAKEQQRERNPDEEETVDERIYRYPGPKPQTKEAGVLMLADNVESASRTLIEPTPKRIEGLVHKLLQLRLEGGQFDESGLSLRELRIIERSLVKTLTAIYHGRIQYPDANDE